MRSKRQIAYGEYLKTGHLEELIGKAVARDGGKCVRCSSEIWLQVHHKVYRGRPEDSLLEDLETLCRKCHREEHGIGPMEIERLAREIERAIGLEKPMKDYWLAIRD